MYSTRSEKKSVRVAVQLVLNQIGGGLYVSTDRYPCNQRECMSIISTRSEEECMYSTRLEEESVQVAVQLVLNQIGGGF